MTVVVVSAPVPWVPAYAGTTVRGEGVLVGDDGCGGFRAAPLGSGSESGKTDGGQNNGGMVGGCWWVVRGGVRSEPGTTVEWVWAVWFFGCLWG